MWAQTYQKDRCPVGTHTSNPRWLLLWSCNLFPLFFSDLRGASFFWCAISTTSATLVFAPQLPLCVEWGAILPDTSILKFSKGKRSRKWVCRKGPVGHEGHHADHEPAMGPCSKEGKQPPGLHWEDSSHQAERDDPSPLLSLGELWFGVLHPTLLPNTRDSLLSWKESNKWVKKWFRVWSTDQMRRGCESWDCLFKPVT